MTDRQRPPLIGRVLLRFQPLGGRREEVEADLLELFELRVTAYGARYAAWRYCLDAISVWRVWRRHDRLAPAATRRHSWWAGVGQDIVFASRVFRREPTLFGLTIGGVALAIAITTSVFTVVHALTNPSTGVPNPESVFQLKIVRGSGQGSPWAYADYLRLRDESTSFEVAAALKSTSGGLELGEVASETEEPRYVRVGVVSGSFFRVMSGRAAIGRVLAESDDRAGAVPAIVLSDRFWKTEFGADSAVLGRTIRLRHELFTVVGVAGPGFTAADTDRSDIPACWMSLTTFFELQERQTKSELGRRWQTVDVFGTVGPTGGVSSVSRVESQATSVVTTVMNERGLSDADGSVHVDATTLAAAAAMRGDESFGALAINFVMTIAALIVLLASANVANLLLANAAGRSREIGVRLTLGASRRRIVRQLLTESLMLGFVGGAAGYVMAFWTAPLLARTLHLPELLEVTPGPHALVVSIGVTIAVGVVAGLAPARYGRHGAVMSSINTDTPAATNAGPSSLRSTLIASQAAASVVLLVVAALLTRALVEVIRFDLGLQAGRLVRVSANFRRSYTDASVRAYFEAAQSRLTHVPGVASVSIALHVPFDFGHAPMAVGPQTGRTAMGYLRGEPALHVLRNETSADYFTTVGAHIIRGRGYTDDEARAAAPVAVISESLATRFWPGEDPIGSPLTRVWGDEIPANGRAMGFLRKPVGTRVIGVVSETITRLQSYDAPALYLPMDPLNLRTARFVVRTSGDPQGLIASIRDAVKSTDPEVEVRATLVSDGLQRELQYPKALALLAAVVGISTLTLAVVGLFGVTAFIVRQRRREVSVRLALGASAADIVNLLLRDSLRPVVAGIAFGLVFALVAGHVIRGLLYGVSGHDPTAILSAVIILLAAAAAAALGPARRALRIDPAEMLKQS